MYRILFVTANPPARKPLKTGLLDQGYRVSVVEPTSLLDEDAVPPASDLIVLDLEGSPIECHRLCHAIKREIALKDLPLVWLVPEDQLGRVDFSWGADDYLTLPVSPKRLGERVKFLMWKRNKIDAKNGLKIGELTIDFERYEVHVNGEPVDLTYKEFELLKFLAQQPGKVFTREVLLNKVWGYDYYGGTRTVDVHIRRLRSKIEVHGLTYVETVRNVGYKFLSPE